MIMGLRIYRANTMSFRSDQAEPVTASAAVHDFGNSLQNGGSSTCRICTTTASLSSSDVGLPNSGQSHPFYNQPVPSTSEGCAQYHHDQTNNGTSFGM